MKTEVINLNDSKEKVYERNWASKETKNIIQFYYNIKNERKNKLQDCVITIHDNQTAIYNVIHIFTKELDAIYLFI